MQFLSPNDPMLEWIAEPLSPDEIRSPSSQQIIDGLLAFAKGEQKDRQRHVLVGLAAPQVGIPLRIILVDVQADGKGNVSDLRAYINPEIISQSQEQSSWYEGCYSTGEIKGIVPRSRQIVIKALDRNGQPITETHEGYVARIFQHEIDHLNGVRFPERMGKDQLCHLVLAEEMPQYRNQEGWRSWKRTIPRDQWRAYL